MSVLLTLFAATSTSTTKSSSAWVTFVPILLIGGVMYMLLIRPQKKKMKAQRDLLSTIEEGDEIITNGGIYGFVTAIDGDVLWVEVDHDKHVEVRIHRSAVTRKINPAVESAGGQPVEADAAADSGDDGEGKSAK
jgi:preprotein translocase subunit YajC